MMELPVGKVTGKANLALMLTVVMSSTSSDNNFLCIIIVFVYFNVVVSFFDIAFIFGLGSTQLLQIAITNKMLDPVLGVIGIFVLPAFFFWTWWLTAVKGYKLAYNIGWSIYLVDFVLLIYLYIQNDEASSLIVDLVLHVVALLVFFKIFDIINNVEFVKRLISPTREYAKDRPRDDRGRIIVDLANPHIIEDMDYFRPTAIHFEKHGTFTNLRPNANPNSEFGKWIREENT